MNFLLENISLKFKCQAEYIFNVSTLNFLIFRIILKPFLLHELHHEQHFFSLTFVERQEEFISLVQLL